MYDALSGSCWRTFATNSSASSRFPSANEFSAHSLRTFLSYGSDEASADDIFHASSYRPSPYRLDASANETSNVPAFSAFLKNATASSSRPVRRQRTP